MPHHAIVYVYALFQSGVCFRTLGAHRIISYVHLSRAACLSPPCWLRLRQNHPASPLNLHVCAVSCEKCQQMCSNFFLFITVLCCQLFLRTKTHFIIILFKQYQYSISCASRPLTPCLLHRMLSALHTLPITDTRLYWQSFQIKSESISTAASRASELFSQSTDSLIQWGFLL